ncbi:hypothetical protein CHISP_2009 [Chitinispirillum alkaliphilum]|nr:hypothetical protein CHISP_2009 [Chitinispirillum alkaliphilum]
MVEEAQEQETLGNYDQALVNYTSALIRLSSRISFPDRQKGKILKPDVWFQQVQNYLSGFSEPQTERSDLYPEIIAGIQRSAEMITAENFPRRLRETALDSSGFYTFWNSTFSFPQQDYRKWIDLADYAYKKGLSFVRIKSAKNYTYELSFFNINTARRTDISMYPETEYRLILDPGEYYLLLQSSVTFAGGQKWRSSRSLFPLSVPSEPSLVEMELRTRVSRNLRE